MKNLIAGAVSLGAVAFLGQSANAQVLAIGNNNSSGDTSPVTFSGVATSTGANLQIDGVTAAGFTTGSTALTLSSIDLSVKRGATLGNSAVRVRLFTGTGSAPTTDTGLTFSISNGATLATTGSVFAMTPSSGSFSLAANTSYWIVLDNSETSGTTTIAWSATGAGGTSAVAQHGSGYTYAGAYGNSKDDLSGSTSTPSNIPNFAVFTTASVPEPHEYALVAGLGLCAFGVYRRRSLMAKA